jgi:hypothetical protein
LPDRPQGQGGDQERRRIDGEGDHASECVGEPSQAGADRGDPWKAPQPRSRLALLSRNVSPQAPSRSRARRREIFSGDLSVEQAAELWPDHPAPPS